MNPGKIRLLILILLAGLIGYGIGITKVSFEWRHFQPQIKVINNEPPPSITTMDFSRFWEVLGKLESTYVDKQAIDQQKVLDGAIAGMVDSLGDPYTLYLPSQQNNNFKNGLAGKFEGIGAELGLKAKQIIIVAPLAGSPAEKAGIKAGDEILKVDGQPTAGWSLDKAVNQIRGQKGTKVTLTILHKSDGSPVDIAVTRDTITVSSVTSWTKEIKSIDEVAQNSTLSKHATDKVAYVRISQFGDNTNDEWLKATNTIRSELDKDKSIKGIVLDLRNNPGGYLSDAVYVASEFIKDGNVVLQEDRNGDRTGYAVSGKGV